MFKKYVIKAFYSGKSQKFTKKGLVKPHDTTMLEFWMAAIYFTHAKL